jgi:hypothetical protein
MRKLLKLGSSVFSLLSTVFFLVSLRSVHAQEAVAIPGPDLKDSSFIQVKDLNIGDVVFVKSETGELVPRTITKLEYKKEPIEVYNLSVDGEQTFFANDFAVHNKPGVDTEKPVCRVIVNPTVSNVNIQNWSFESPLWCRTYKDEDGEKWPCMNCPDYWFNRSDGGKHNNQDWCDYGLSVTNAGWHPDGNQHVGVGYPNFGGFQRISGLETFNPNKVLYRGSAWGQGCAAYIGLRDGGRYGNIASVANTSTCGWSHGSLLGWDFDTFHLICRNCEEGDGAAFDLVYL